MIKKCKTCGNVFETNFGYQKHCSQTCNQRNKTQRYYERNLKRYGIRTFSGYSNCEFCGKKFPKAKKEQRFCSHKCHERSHKYYIEEKNLNINYFKNIDNQHKAYWLGFLFGDGYVGKNNNFVRLILAEEDECLLDMFSKEVSIPNDYRKYYGPYKSNKQKQVHLTIRNKTFVKHLVNWGCINSKSKSLKFPHIDYKNEFLLGLYDADGVKGTSILTGGCLEFFQEIKDRFQISNKIARSGTTYRMNLGCSLLREIWNDFDYGLQRKRRFGIYKYKRKYAKKEKIERVRLKKFDPSPEELREKIIEHHGNICSVGRHYNVTDNAIRKRCKKYNIDYKNILID